MAIPSISLAPSSGEEANLPIAVTVTGTNIFERPNYTGRELFTQSGTDAPVGDWKGGAVQVDGIIGKAFRGNGTTAYVNISSKVIPIAKYVMISGWFNNSSSNPSQTIIADSPLLLNGALQIRLNATGQVQFRAYGEETAGTRKEVTSVSSYNDGSDHHFWFVCDINTPSTPIVGIVDKTDVGTVTINDSMSSFESDTITFEIGTNLYSGIRYSFFDGDVCGVYWSTNSATSTEMLKYSNLPTVEIN